MKKIVLLMMVSGVANAGLESTAAVHASASSGFHGSMTPVMCTHHVAMTNNSEKNFLARVFYRVCAEGQKGTCKEAKVEQMMIPHAVWEHNFTSQYAFSWPYAGDYKVTCSSSIVGGAYMEDSGNVHIV